jgi:hypothetical protein
MAGKEKVHRSGALENRMRYVYTTNAGCKRYACAVPKRQIDLQQIEFIGARSKLQTPYH